MIDMNQIEKENMISIIRRTSILILLGKYFIDDDIEKMKILSKAAARESNIKENVINEVLDSFIRSINNVKDKEVIDYIYNGVNNE